MTVLLSPDSVSLVMVVPSSKMPGQTIWVGDKKTIHPNNLKFHILLVSIIFPWFHCLVWIGQFRLRVGHNHNYCSVWSYCEVVVCLLSERYFQWAVRNQATHCLEICPHMWITAIPIVDWTWTWTLAMIWLYNPIQFSVKNMVSVSEKIGQTVRVGDWKTMHPINFQSHITSICIIYYFLGFIGSGRLDNCFLHDKGRTIHTTIYD